MIVIFILSTITEPEFDPAGIPKREDLWDILTNSTVFKSHRLQAISMFEPVRVLQTEPTRARLSRTRRVDNLGKVSPIGKGIPGEPGIQTKKPLSNRGSFR